jgi:Ca-activated chloride channel homolog
VSPHLIPGWDALVPPLLFFAAIALTTIVICRTTSVGTRAQRLEVYPVSLVALPVSVTDWHGRFVAGLQEADFRVFEDGHRRDIAAFREENEPITIGLVLDCSESVRWRHRALADIATGFLEQTKPTDDVFLVTFNQHAFLCLPANHPRGNNLRLLEEAIRGFATEGETALYDAILLATEQIKQSTRQRRALIIISDGDDNASQATRQQVLAQLECNSVVVYSLGIVALGQTGSDPAFLKQLSTITGGKAYIVDDRAIQSPVIAHRLATELREQYTIVYATSNSKESSVFHNVRVKARSPYHKILFVRTRAGYVAHDRSASILQTNGHHLHH